MKLYAIGDLHLGHPPNRQALAAIPPHPEDWLILAGDVGETEAQLDAALAFLSHRFAQLIWVPGNHDLWTLPSDPSQLRGEPLYQRLVAICRSYGVLTPEDPFIRWPGAGPACWLVPLFTLYDYSFRPAHIRAEQALAWAEEEGIVCADEVLLHPDPYPSRPDWCAARCAYSEARLQQLPPNEPLILINHYPLRYDLVNLPRIPRFSLWCGTQRTAAWPTHFAVHTAIFGHLHMRTTTYRDGVRFEEVSLGYPHQWRSEQGIASYLREILPGPDQTHA